MIDSQRAVKEFILLLISFLSCRVDNDIGWMQAINQIFGFSDFSN